MRLAPRRDVEFSVDLAQVVVDGRGADEEPLGDLRIGRSAGREPCDPFLLRCEVRAPFVVPLPTRWLPLRAVRYTLVRRKLGLPSNRTHRAQPRVEPRVASSLLAAEPFTVDKLCPRELHGRAACPELVDRLQMVAFHARRVVEQGPGSGQKTEIESASRCRRTFGQHREEAFRDLSITASYVRFDHVGRPQRAQGNVFVDSFRCPTWPQPSSCRDRARATRWRSRSRW